MLDSRRLIRHAAAALALGLGLAAAPAAAVAEEALSAVTRGGRLYDNWYKELGEKPPTQRQPSYPIGGIAAADPARTWRCVECHGWDYRGKDGAAGDGETYVGIKGIDGMAGAAPAAVLAVLEDARHGYGEQMDAADLADLAAFVARGQTALMARIDPKTRHVAGDAAQGVAVYQTVCITCHGADGQQIAAAPPLGDLAREDPWQALHSIVNGHPGGVMPALRALDDAVVLGTLAHMQKLPARELISSLTRGGRLYDNWARETGRMVPNGVHPAYPRTITDESDQRATWKCRECHGWDYRGKDGAFASGRHATGIKGIRALMGGEARRVAGILRDDTHRYTGVLTQRDIVDLANFVTQGQIDMSASIDARTGRFQGDAGRFEPHFQTMCAGCHGKDGRKVRTMPPLGRVVQEDPWRALHSVVNGHPGENMPPLRAFPQEMVAGLLAFAQTLPEKK